jgi:hypothetical protein
VYFRPELDLQIMDSLGRVPVLVDSGTSVLELGLFVVVCDDEVLDVDVVGLVPLVLEVGSDTVLIPELVTPLVVDSVPIPVLVDVGLSLSSVVVSAVRAVVTLGVADVGGGEAGSELKGGGNGSSSAGTGTGAGSAPCLLFSLCIAGILSLSWIVIGQM